MCAVHTWCRQATLCRSFAHRLQTFLEAQISVRARISFLQCDDHRRRTRPIRTGGYRHRAYFFLGYMCCYILLDVFFTLFYIPDDFSIKINKERKRSIGTGNG